jgi:hypothetical protein
MKSIFSKIYQKIIFGLAIGTILAGCERPEYPEPIPASGASTARNNVLLVNASPDAQPLTVTLENSPFASNLGFMGVNNNGYVAVPAGQRVLRVTGGNVAKEFAVRQNFSANGNSTIFVTDLTTRAGSSTDQGGVRTITLADNLSAPAAGRAKVRFVNLAPSSPSGGYGIFNSTANTFLFSAAPIRRYRDVTTGSGASTIRYENFTEINAGAYTLDVRTAATATPTVAPTVFTFEAGKIYTLYIRGNASNPPVGISIIRHN